MSAKETIEKVISNEKLAENVVKITVDLADQPPAGTFYMLRAWEREPLLSRPISVGSSTEDSVTFYVLVKGMGTRIFEELRDGDSLLCAGPLGNGFTKESGKVALIGGGIGTAPLIGLSHELEEAPDVFVGFLDTPYALEDFRHADLQIATDSGNVGHKGFVTELLDPTQYDAVYACGPTPMLAAVAKLCEGKTKLYLSLEAHMACGVGACLGCAVRSGDTYLRVCKDGPVFLSTEVQL